MSSLSLLSEGINWEMFFFGKDVNVFDGGELT